MVFTIILLRILVPLTILRFPFFGGVASAVLDGADWQISLSDIFRYPLLDKALDIYYLSIEAFVVVVLWKHVFAKRLGLVLYALRALGTAFFLVTNSSYFLFYFPNVFENFFLFYTGVWMILREEPKLSGGLLWAVLIILAIPKLFQEYLMHVSLLENWRFVQIPLLGITYDNVQHQALILLGLILVTSYLQLKSRSYNNR
jgi:hypothetical protein